MIGSNLWLLLGAPLALSVADASKALLEYPLQANKGGLGGVAGLEKYLLSLENPPSDHTPLLVAFHAPWCGHCKRLKPILDEAATIIDSQLSSKPDSPIVLSIDCEAHKLLCSKEFHINAFPTVRLFTSPRSFFLSANSNSKKSKSSETLPPVEGLPSSDANDLVRHLLFFNKIRSNGPPNVSGAVQTSHIIRKPSFVPVDEQWNTSDWGVLKNVLLDYNHLIFADNVKNHSDNIFFPLIQLPGEDVARLCGGSAASCVVNPRNGKIVANSNDSFMYQSKGGERTLTNDFNKFILPGVSVSTRRSSVNKMGMFGVDVLVLSTESGASVSHLDELEELLLPGTSDKVLKIVVLDKKRADSNTNHFIESFGEQKVKDRDLFHFVGLFLPSLEKTRQWGQARSAPLMGLAARLGQSPDEPLDLKSLISDYYQDRLHPLDLAASLAKKRGNRSSVFLLLEHFSVAVSYVLEPLLKYAGNSSLRLACLITACAVIVAVCVLGLEALYSYIFDSQRRRETSHSDITQRDASTTDVHDLDTDADSTGKVKKD